MKTAIVVFLLLQICIINGGVSAEELHIAGFFDIIGTYHSSSDDETSFSLGQAEIDLEQQIKDNILGYMAVAYNSIDSKFELAGAFAEINLSSKDDAFISSISLTAGQFDVPFGIDYKVYASPDRKLITSPLTVDYTHEGWNDFGVQLIVLSIYGNLVAYIVNGFESSYEVIDDAQSLILEVPIGEEINTTPANAFGGRLGLIPFEYFEAGGSIAVGINKSNKDEMIMYGLDMQARFHDFGLKAEYIKHSLNRSIEEESNQGYYIQSMYNFNRAFIVGRYGAFQSENNTWSDRISVGAGYIIAEGVELRYESTINASSDMNTNTIQLVAGF